MQMWRQRSKLARRITFVIVCVSGLMVVLSLVTSVYFSASNVARRTLERLASEYYEGFLYGEFIAASDKQTAEALADFDERGMPEVRLRQLILYGSGKNKQYKEVFDNEHYRCDMDQTTIIYHPVAPYGVKDYTTEYNTSCKEIK